MAIKFGLATYKGIVAGLEIQTISIDDVCSEAEAMDEDGNITQIDQYGFKTTISGTGNIKSDVTLALSVGGTLTVDGKTFTINSVSKSISNTGHHSCNFAGTAPWSESEESEESDDSGDI